MAFGRELQLEREKRGVSLEAVSERTKISTRFLEALEIDDFSSLPGGVFQRGVVRSYCETVGLDQAEWLRRLSSMVEGSQVDVDWASFAENIKKSRVRSGGASRFRWWGVVGLIVVLVALSWMVWRFVVAGRIG